MPPPAPTPAGRNACRSRSAAAEGAEPSQATRATAVGVNPQVFGDLGSGRKRSARRDAVAGLAPALGGNVVEFAAAHRPS